MMASEMASNFTPWLTLAIFVPIAFGLIILAIGNDQRAPLVRVLALVAAVVSFLITLPQFRPNLSCHAVCGI